MRHNIVLTALLSSLILSCGTEPVATVADISDRTFEQVPAASLQATLTLKIVGASTPYPAIDLLGNAYNTQSSTQIALLDSSQSGGGIAAVKAGLVDIGTVTRVPKSEEADDDLAYREVARDALLVVTHPSVEGVGDLTTEALQAIYSGQATNWQTFGGPDADIVVLDRAEDTSAKRLLREYYLGSTLENAPEAIVLRRESDVIEAIQDTPYSVGVLSRAKVITQALPVNILSLDGVTPTPENLTSGKYAMHRTLGIVWYATPSEATQGFIDFIFSETGADILRQAGYATAVE